MSMIPARHKAGHGLNSPDISFFWKISLKWYFFPVFYLFLVICVALVDSYYQGWTIGGVLFSAIFALVYLPNGLWWNLEVLQNLPGHILAPVAHIFPWFFHAFWIYSASLIQESWGNRIVMKKLIIALLLLMILAFAGCVYQISLPDHSWV